MANTVGLQNAWHQGIKRDVARDRMPKNTLWDAVDVIANYGAPLRERGGWVNHSQSITAVTAGVDEVQAGVYATFSNSSGVETSKNLAIARDANVSTYLIDATAATAATLIGAGGAVGVSQNPVFHGGAAASAATAVFTGLVIIPYSQSVAPYKYDGTTLATLGGTPPSSNYATVYKDYTVLGSGGVGGIFYPNRIWFSPEGDPDCAVSSVTAWDTTDSWIDMSRGVKGLASTRNALLVFHDNAVTRIRGSIPPPDEDMVVDDGLFDVGLTEAFSIASHHDNVIWAAPEGVFRTDGAILDDMTRRGGMLRYWLDLMADATSSWTFAGAVIRDTYFLCVMDGSTFKDAFAINLLSLSWTRLSNVKARAMWAGQFNDADELYWGRKDAAFVCRMSTVFQVGDSTYKNDGNDTAVTSVIETPYYALGKPGAKRVRRAFVTFDQSDYGTDNPTCDVSYILTPEETSYTSAGSLSETAEMKRLTFDIRKQAQGVAFKFTRANAGDFSLHAVECECWEYEQTRRL